MMSIIAGFSSFAQNPIPADERIPDLNYFIVPGTMSYRLDGSNNPALVQDGPDQGNVPDYLVRGHYYGYDNGGARTSWNSSQYLDFTFFQHPTNPNWITDPHQVDSLPVSGNNGYNSSGNPPKWLGLNFRIAYPSSSYYNVDTTSKETLYPLILFMHGAGERADCWGGNCYGYNSPDLWNNDHSIVHGGKQHLDAINRNPSDPRHWPGYVVVPQNKNGYNPGPALETWTGRVIALVEQLVRDYPIDPNRIYIHGLSEGGRGTWMLLNSRPDLFAASAPMSGHVDHGAFDSDYISMDTSMIHIPVWQFQGGRDNRPKPEGTGNKIKKLRNMGGTPRYTVYPNLGHGVWNTAYAEPDFFSWFLQYSKLTIHGYYGIKEVCEGDQVNVRLGVSKYFENYEWRKTTNGGSTYSTVPPSPERDNEIIADEYGDYQVRIMRNGVWSDWSDPYTITSKPRPSALISAEGSTALTALDGATDVTLTTEEDGIYYEWFKNGSLYLEDSTFSQITVSDPGAYTLIKKDIGLCNSFESNTLYVSTQPYSGNLPFAPNNLTASASSENAINLFWQDMSNNELGFEIYRSKDNVNFQWVTTTQADILMYHDTMLDGDTEYFYKIRSYNQDGASAASNVTSASTLADNVLPTAPANFKFSHFGYEENRINVQANNDAEEYFIVRTDSAVFSWLPSTDNVGIDHYEVYFGDGTLAGSTTNTTVSITGLEQNTSYNFYAVAIDVNGNTSNPSSLEAITTTMQGLYYNLYAGGTWDYIHEFSNWALFDDGFGSVSNFNYTSAKSGKYEDDDYFGIEFFGYIYIEIAGTYTFYTNSDDGSRLWIGDQEIVDNDGLHGGRWREGNIELEEGAYPITVQYFERSGGQGLTVAWKIPGGNRVNIPSNVLRSGPITTSNPPSPPLNLVADADGSGFSIDLTWDYEVTDIVVLGSSTAAGYGLTGNEKSWVEKLDSLLFTNNANYTLTNLAQNGGYTTYHVREDGEDGGGYANAPNPDYNITHALSLNPDIIIVNLPSNNVADNIDISTTIQHYQELKTLADDDGVEIFFTTTQPRDFNTNSVKRHLLEDEANVVRQNFGQYVIDIYDELTDFGNDNRIKSQYAQGDGTHLNILGHNYILSEVLATVGQHMPKFEIYQSEAGGPFSILNTTSYAAESYTATNLKPATNYSYKVKTVNLFGSSTDSNIASATTAADTDPPSQPQNLVVRSKTSTKVTLSWDNSTDNIGVAGYLITYSETSEGSQSGRKSKSSSKTEAQSMSSTNNGVTVEGLTPETSYTFSVAALDASSNQSLESAPLAAETESNGPLPVEFFYFDYTIRNKDVVLTWKTASEQDNSHFEIERGFGINDFVSIGEIQGAGTSTDVQVYQFVDKNPKSSNLYRIKQVDFDGKSDYSNIIRVDMKIDPFEDLRLFPNPTSAENINIVGRAELESEKIIIVFTDMVGKAHLSLETDSDSIVNGISINLSRQLKPGIYMVSITDGSRMSQKKLVIR
ncbi:fibronectin type III domain-containing protein [Fulvivirga sp.]|uniref:fibronectin type III domain-containing protein n=1 Tax=Fulvivirga sp. TaxID=1931237 RepID=UPI0032EAAF62